MAQRTTNRDEESAIALEGAFRRGLYDQQINGAQCSSCFLIKRDLQ